MAPVAMSPNITTDVAPGPLQQEAQPEREPEKPIEKIELPPDPKTEPVVALTPPPKPIEPPKEKKLKHASLARAPTRADQQADRLAAAMPGVSSRNSDAMPNWIAQVSAKIQRNKRYPSEARGDLGVVHVRFSVDRQGGIHSVRLVKSSGSGVLDKDALALVQRAEPLPPPPPEMPGAQIPLSQQINYNR
jgi:protein TonB